MGVCDIGGGLLRRLVGTTQPHGGQTTLDACWEFAVGRSTTNVAPPPGVWRDADLAVGAPPRSRPRWPGPGPCRRPCRARGRGRRGRTARTPGGPCSGSMPGPWSRTCDLGAGRAPRRPTAISIGVPAGVWLTALPTRLVSTWRSRRSSPCTTVGASVAVEPEHGDRPVGVEGAGVLGRVGGEHGQVDGRRAASGRWSSSRASSSRSSTSPPIRVASSSIRRMALATSSGVADGALAVELGVAADGGQRGAQLVAGVGDELAHPRLGGRPHGERRARSGRACR